MHNIDKNITTLGNVKDNFKDMNNEITIGVMKKLTAS